MEEVIFSLLEKISWEYVMFSQQVLLKNDICTSQEVKNTVSVHSYLNA